MTILNENTGLKTLNNVSVGENVKLFSFVNAYHCSINDNSKVGTFVEIQRELQLEKIVRSQVILLYVRAFILGIKFLSGMV